MATIEQQREVAQSLKYLLEQTLGLELSSFIREDLGVSLNFGDIEWIFKDIYSLLEKINLVELTEVPYGTLETFRSTFESRIWKGMIAIKDFNVSVNNPVHVRNNLMQGLLSHYDNFRQAGLNLLVMAKLLQDDKTSAKEQLNDLFKEAESKIDAKVLELDTTISSVQTKKGEVEKILESVRTASTDVGVTKYAGFFLNEHTEYKVLADWWLGATFLVLAIIIGFSFFILDKPHGGSSAEMLYFTIARLIVISALFFALGVCNRNRKACRHNAIVNKHRHNALKTFETFSSSTGDEQTKSAVLLEATHTIFGNQQTGYLQNDSDKEPNSKIIEIFKSVVSKE